MDFRYWCRITDKLFKILILTDYLNGTAQQTADNIAYDLARKLFTNRYAKDGKARTVSESFEADPITDQLPSTAKEQYGFTCFWSGNKDSNQKQFSLCKLINAVNFGGVDIRTFVDKWTHSLAACWRSGIELKEDLQVLLFILNIDISGKYKRWVYFVPK
ncbi:hypothetical protein GTA08_BOTSDO00959 [Botryosphaeria dothidea]|uniref:Uncharacterized protein n=1 Tax=Botryosphaeria dothidea TaxID=55169 RepID=A0A8H4JA06_9PEZI|nr:hypothetical protein GTA08_BOTSDO00959 [Botryosphaeria dothidea]